MWIILAYSWEDVHSTIFDNNGCTEDHVRKEKNLFNIALKLLVSDGQRAEELLQAHCGALLSGVGGPQHQVAFVVKHQLGPHLAGPVAGHHTQMAGKGKVRWKCSLEMTAKTTKSAVESIYLRAHKELRASPLNPNVSTWIRSVKSLSFDV